MVRAWMYNDSLDHPSLPHRFEPNVDVSLEELKVVGVIYFKFDGDSYEQDQEYINLKASRGYNYQDVVTVSPATLPNYEEKVKSFFKEHLHADEEIRFIVDGSGYFDVRSKDDKWIRISLEKGDLIILPAGIYHRFIVDDKNYLKAVRLFCGEPVWTPIDRPRDDHPARQSYVKSLPMNA